MPTSTCSLARRYRLTLSYDGTHYSGWQVQARNPTIQGEVESALAVIVRHPCKVHGSGRTDQGVHARGQVAHVDLDTHMTPDAIRRALNTRLPEDIRVTRVGTVDGSFHARRDAVVKEYRYFIFNGEWVPPHERLYALHVREDLDDVSMQAAAERFVGEHDFVAFMANPNRAVDSSVRMIDRFTVKRRGKRIVCSVRGNGFLYKQVRSMVGLLLRVGLGAERPELVTELLTRKANRTARVPSAPPQGLFLWQVWYGRDST